MSTASPTSSQQLEGDLAVDRVRLPPAGCGGPRAGARRRRFGVCPVRRWRVRGCAVPASQPGGEPEACCPAPACCRRRPRRPSARASWRVIASPRPVPPYLRVVELSACSKALNRAGACARGRCRCPCPPPRSARSTLSAGSSQRGRAGRCCRAAVNLTALLAKLSRAWRSRVGSPQQARRARRRDRPAAAAPWPAAALGEHATRRCRRSRRGRRRCRSSVSLPASIFERSRMSLMIASRCWPASLDLVQALGLRGRQAVRAAAGGRCRGWRSSGCGSRGSCWPGRRSWPCWRLRRSRPCGVR